MKVEVQWKKLVKPSVPTPNSRQKWKLSAIDNVQPPIYVGVIFYYKHNAENPEVDISERLHQMEESLSKTLTLFYPMAGRYSQDGCFIDCNDFGVEFVHTKVDGQIDEVLHGGPDMDLLNGLSESPANRIGNPLVVIQVNTFQCGGFAISLQFLHKIGDVYTFAMFINSWATACQGNIDSIVCPSFELSSLFPMKECPLPDLPPPNPDMVFEEFVVSRFRFSGNSIWKMKAQARDGLMGNDSQPTRVELVSALISRALVDIDEKKHGEQRPFVICMSFHLRDKMHMAIPANSCGNLSALIFARSDQPTATNSNLKSNGMVSIIRRMISDAKTRYSTVVDKEDFLSMLNNSVTEFRRLMSTRKECLIPISSWCWFGLSEINFGWGKPTLISTGPMCFRSVLLIDDEESGEIGAWVTIGKDEMILLKQDPEILAFTS